MSRMPLRDADIRQAAHEDGIRPGDPSWDLLRELQARRDAEGEKREPAAARHEDRATGRLAGEK